MNDYKDIKTLLLQFASLGIKKSNPTGALLIGKAPHIAENAWLNRIYPEVGEDEIITMEKEINKIIPTSYVDFLTKFSNGLNFFYFNGTHDMNKQLSLKDWEELSSKADYNDTLYFNSN